MNILNLERRYLCQAIFWMCEQRGVTVPADALAEYLGVNETTIKNYLAKLKAKPPKPSPEMVKALVDFAHAAESGTDCVFDRMVNTIVDEHHHMLEYHPDRKTK